MGLPLSPLVDIILWLPSQCYTRWGPRPHLRLLTMSAMCMQRLEAEEAEEAAKARRKAGPSHSYQPRPSTAQRVAAAGAAKPFSGGKFPLGAGSRRSGGSGSLVGE